MEYIDQECFSSNGEETSEPTSEYDSSIYSDNDDIEFLSASSEENYFAPNTQKFKASVSDDDIFTDKVPNKEGLKKERPSPPLLKTKNKKNCETTENSQHIINIPCKDLAKGPTAETWAYNITLPKNTGNFVINLKRRKFKTITLNCTFGESVTLLHQASNAVITSNTQGEQSKLSVLFVFFRYIRVIPS